MFNIVQVQKEGLCRPKEKHDLDAPEQAGEDVHEEGEDKHQDGHLADRRPHHIRKLVPGHAAWARGRGEK